MQTIILGELTQDQEDKCYMISFLLVSISFDTPDNQVFFWKTHSGQKITE